MTWEVITGDCLEVMPTLAAGSIDAIITDIPYGTTACSWDSVIPFEPMWSAIRHVLKPRGVFVTTASQPFTSALVMSNPKWFRYEWVWRKMRPTGYPMANYRPMKRHENILIFSLFPATYTGGESAVYNPQGIYNLERVITRTNGHNTASSGGELGLSVKSNNAGFPQSVLEFNNTNKETSLHPTQKPVALYEYLIRTYTNEGETVLDMTAGSGTTGVAAINTGRNVILIEQRDDYADIARQRCEEAAAQADRTVI